MVTPRHGCALGLAIAGLVLAPVAAADVEPIRLTYSVPSQCLAEDAFVAEVRRAVPELRIASRDEPARVFSVTVAPDREGALEGRLGIEKDGRVVGLREVRGGDCDEIARLLAFAVGLALAPDTLTPRVTAAAPAPAALPTPVPPPVAVVREHALAVSRPWWGLSAHTSVASDLAPGATFGGGVSAELGWRLRGFAPSVRVGIEYAASVPEAVDGARVDFADVLGLVEACDAPWTSVAGRLSVGVCARADAGARIVTGTDIPNGHSVTRPWFALGPAAHLRWHPVGRFFVDLGGGVFFAAVQDRVRLSPQFQVQNVDLVGLRGELAVGFEFR